MRASSCNQLNDALVFYMYHWLTSTTPIHPYPSPFSKTVINVNKSSHYQQIRNSIIYFQYLKKNAKDLNWVTAEPDHYVKILYMYFHVKIAILSFIARIIYKI